MPSKIGIPNLRRTNQLNIFQRFSVLTMLGKTESRSPGWPPPPKKEARRATLTFGSLVAGCRGFSNSSSVKNTALTPSTLFKISVAASNNLQCRILLSVFLFRQKLKPKKRYWYFSFNFNYLNFTPSFHRAQTFVTHGFFRKFLGKSRRAIAAKKNFVSFHPSQNQKQVAGVGQNPVRRQLAIFYQSPNCSA